MTEIDHTTARPRKNTPWISRYNHLLVPGMRVLDLGCGTGDDSVEIVQLGCQVAALDLNLERVRQLPDLRGIMKLAGSMTSGLPFRPETFHVVVASLSIHYFTSEDTRRAVQEISRVLKPGGGLLCRVNAAGDINFGYKSGAEIEPSVFRQPEGHIKRFFDPDMLGRFLEPCFRLELIVPRTIRQRGIEKRTLECLARKR